MSIEAHVPLRLRSVWPSLVLLAIGATTVGCASTARHGDRSAASGHWDTAVRYSREAPQNDPQQHEDRIAPERAMITPSRQHITDHILTANQLLYRVVNPPTITVVPETLPKQEPSDELVMQTFDISHADVQELAQLLNQIVRVPKMAVQPSIIPNTLGNTITVRATATVTSIIEQVIAANDRPRADIVIDVEILEVNRDRTRRYGLTLTDHALDAVSSPEVAPPTDALPPSAVGSPPPSNLTISRGVSTTDFYLGVPAAVVRSLETDSETKLVAKPQLRGQEGQTMTLSLGGDIPVPTTAFTPMTRGGVVVNPLTAFNYRPVGVIVEMTPRVTFENEIILDLMVENSTLGPGIDVAGTSLPTVETRRVVTRLRLRDGESSLLAGLLRDEDREMLGGFPGVLGVPLLWSQLGTTEEAIRQTDIVMLLTPRIVRTHELTQRDIDPIQIGTQTNLALTGPPALSAAPDPEPDTDAATPEAATDPAPPAEPVRLKLTRWLSGRESPQEQPAGSGTAALTGLAFSRTLLDEPLQ